MILNKNSEYNKQYQRDQQTVEPYDNLYRKILQDNFIDKSEYEPLCNNFTKYLDDRKTNLSQKYEQKTNKVL